MEDPEGTPAEVGSGPAESDSNLQQPSIIETNTVKYFLGGLSWDTDEDAVRVHFQQFGQVTEAIVMRERITGEARGFGFVSIAASSAPQVESSEHTIGGRKIDLKRSLPHPKKTRKLFVGGLGADVHDDMLKEYFEQFGAIDEAQVMFDHTTGRSRGFGFITFDDDSSVERVFGAGRMHTIGGKQVEIKPATPRGSGPAGMVMGPRTFPAVMPGRGAGRGYGEMGPMAGGFSRPYAGMVPYTVGGRMPPMAMFGAMSAQGMGGYPPYSAYAMMLQQQQQQQLMQHQQQLGAAMGSPYRTYSSGRVGYERGPFMQSQGQPPRGGSAPSGAYAYGYGGTLGGGGEVEQGGYDYDYGASYQAQPPQPAQRQPPRDYR